MQLENRNFRAAVLYVLFGMLVGLHMGMSNDHRLAPAHAHWLLLGWVSLFLAGCFFKFYPAVQGGLARAHWWVANLGVLPMAPGIALITTGNESVGTPIAVGGSLVVFVGMIVFAILVFRGTRKA